VGHLRDLVGFLKDNSDWLVKFAQGVMLAAGILATYALATKIMEIGAAVEGLTAVLALNPWALLITGVVASGAIIYKTLVQTSPRRRTRPNGRLAGGRHELTREEQASIEWQTAK